MDEDQLLDVFFQKSTTPAIISRTDSSDFSIVEVNEAFRSLMKLNENIAGKSLWQILNRNVLSPYAEKKIRDGIEKALHNGEVVYLMIAGHQKSLIKSFWNFEILPAGEGDRHRFILKMYDASNRVLNVGEKDDAELNEQLAITNEELITMNEELIASQDALQLLNLNLEQRIAQRTQALKESENRLRNIMETIPQMAWTSNVEGKINFHNQQWYRYTGLSLDTEFASDWKWYLEEQPDLAGQTYPKGWAKVVHPEDLETTSNNFLAILRSGQGGEFETRLKRSDGAYRWHLNRLSPLINKEGKVDLWVGTATDIDDLKRLQQQKDDFISVASHELKTPLTALNASFQVIDRLRETPGHEMFPTLITQCRKSIQRVSALVEDLLNVGRLQKGSMQLNKSNIILYQVINACCKHLAVAGKQRVDIMGEADLEVFADEHRIEQVVTNLVNNAIKYAPHSEVISISIQKEGTMAKVLVMDHGPGIPQEQMGHLFDRYCGADPRGNHVSGLGLGLYISYEIIKQHGGEISVQSEPGKGTTFWFTVPCQVNQDISENDNFN